MIMDNGCICIGTYYWYWYWILDGGLVLVR